MKSPLRLFIIALRSMAWFMPARSETAVSADEMTGKNVLPSIFMNRPNDASAGILGRYADDIGRREEYVIDNCLDIFLSGDDVVDEIIGVWRAMSMAAEMIQDERSEP